MAKIDNPMNILTPILLFDFWSEGWMMPERRYGEVAEKKEKKSKKSQKNTTVTKRGRPPKKKDEVR